MLCIKHLYQIGDNSDQCKHWREGYCMRDTSGTIYVDNFYGMIILMYPSNHGYGHLSHVHKYIVNRYTGSSRCPHIYATNIWITNSHKYIVKRYTRSRRDLDVHISMQPIYRLPYLISI